MDIKTDLVTNSIATLTTTFTTTDEANSELQRKAFALALPTFAGDVQLL